MSSAIPSALCRVIFERCVLDNLLSRIGELSPVDDVQDEKVLSLAETCLSRGGTTEDLTQAVLAGKIRAVACQVMPDSRCFESASRVTGLQDNREST